MKNDKTLIPFKLLDSKKDFMNIKDHKDSTDIKYSTDLKDLNIDHKYSTDHKDLKYSKDIKDIKYSKDIKDLKDLKDLKDHKDIKYSIDHKHSTELKETKAPKIKPQSISLDSLAPLEEVILGKRKNITNKLYIFNNKKIDNNKNIMS